MTVYSDEERPRPCRCGHTALRHEHYGWKDHCVTCDCRHYRRARVTTVDIGAPPLLSGWGLVLVTVLAVAALFADPWLLVPLALGALLAEAAL